MGRPAFDQHAVTCWWKYYDQIRFAGYSRIKNPTKQQPVVDSFCVLSTAYGWVRHLTEQLACDEERNGLESTPLRDLLVALRNRAPRDHRALAKHFLAAIDTLDRLQEKSQVQPQIASAKTPPVLNQTEENILEALGNKLLTGKEIARLAGYSYGSHLKSELASLKRRGIIVSPANGRGYRRAT
jgi:hypothetical protein